MSWTHLADSLAHGMNIGHALQDLLHEQLGEGMLHFETENQLVIQQQDDSRGIGLKNVRRRLSLLYPGQHTLRVWQEQDTFRVSLEINVNQSN